MHACYIALFIVVVLLCDYVTSELDATLPTIPETQFHLLLAIYVYVHVINCHMAIVVALDRRTTILHMKRGREREREPLPIIHKRNR